MFLARIDGHLTATRKHETLEACRLLLAQRLNGDGSTTGEPLLVIDHMGARLGTVVMVSTDGTIARKLLGNNTPARLTVCGIVDEVHPNGGAFL
jgi:ethanolamine utilization protein EutN